MGNEDTVRNGHETQNLGTNVKIQEGPREVHHRKNLDRGFLRGIIKLEFSRLANKNPSNWVYRASQYFLYHQVPPGQRIFTASFHIDDEALIWFQDASVAGVFHSWEEFVQAVHVRFELPPYNDLIERH